MGQTRELELLPREVQVPSCRLGRSDRQRISRLRVRMGFTYMDLVRLDLIPSCCYCCCCLAASVHHSYVSGSM